MHRRHCLVVPLLAASALSGCASDPRPAQNAILAPFPFAYQQLSRLADNSMRLIVYWPSVPFATKSRPLVIVDGNMMGNPVENQLMTVNAGFVVDLPREIVGVWWADQGAPHENTIELRATQGRLRYLRWTTGLGNGILQEVDEKRAVGELANMHLSGYVLLPAATRNR